MAAAPGAAPAAPGRGRRARRRAGTWLGAWSLGWTAAAAAAALASYVAAPCATWHVEARDPAPRARAAARAAFAARVAARCNDLGTRAVSPGFTCSAETEAADLPAVPRACLGRAHRTLRLLVDGGAAPTSSDAATARAMLGRVGAALTGAFPDDGALAHLGVSSPDADPGLDGLRALGFRMIEVVRDGQRVGRFAVTALAAPAADAPERQAAGAAGG